MERWQDSKSQLVACYIVHMAKREKAKVVSSKVAYRGPVFQVTTDYVQEPGGIASRRDVVRHQGSVVIMAVDDTDAEPMVLLVRQYRHAANDYLWELPAGRIDKGENALTGARRELLEETGYSAQRWKRALFFWVSPGFLDETMAVYLATGLKKGKAAPEEDENISIRFFPLRQAVRMAIGGGFRDAKTIASVLWLEQLTRSRS